ncbi:MAG: DUF423 domain-containing protein [Bdellovibrionales bacterium]|nr:DUF423 domain-containing protein [Bdellovibrionales bacterium]
MKKLTQRHSTLHALLAGTLFLFLAVAIGAFGAHGLESRLSEKLLKTYTTGVTYQFYHALGLLILGVIQLHLGEVLRLALSIYLFMIGIILFSFNCYIYALTEIKLFALIVPLGGLCFLIGWLVAFIKFANLKRKIN